jgi:geranylgeranyl diphosphate synthase type I
MIEKEQVEALLRAAMQRPFPAHDARTEQFYQMMEYHLGWRDEQLRAVATDPGKLIRPRLCLLACQAVGGDLRQALPVAAALQLIHDFTLVHDDIQDRSDQRRGRPTVWRLWGEAQGINVGDGLFIISHMALERLVEAGVSARLALTIMREFDATVLRICEGQFLDLSFEDRLDLDETDYMAMIERKTAALIAAALQLGALAGGADGQDLGLAFQIQDDVLGIWGDPQVTGKPFAADLFRRKKSLPVVYALAHAGAEDQAQLRAIYSKPIVDEHDLELLLDVLERAGARAYAEAEAARLHQDALAALDQTPGGGALDELRALAQSLLGRAR